MNTEKASEVDKMIAIQENAKRMEEEYQKRLIEIIKLSEEQMTKDGNIKENEVTKIMVKRAYCPACGQELTSKLPKMFNPFTQESQCIHVCSNRDCNTKYNLEYSYPRIVFYNENNEEIFAHCE